MELRDGGDRFGNVFENAATGIVIADPNRNYVAVNDRFCEITGYARELLLTMGCGQIVHPDDQAMDAAGIGRLVRGESKSFTCDLRYIHASGSIVWVSAQVSVFQNDPQGGILIIGVVEDITKRKRLEEVLHKREAGLRSVLDSSMDVIYRLNLRTGRYEYVSPSCEAVIGHSADQIMALGAGAIQVLIHPDDLPDVNAKLARLEVSGKEEVEGRFIKRGECRWFSNSMFLVRDSDGRPLYRDGNVRDITERKRREAALAFMADIQNDLARLTSVDEIMQAVGSKIGTFLDVSFSFFAEIDEAGNQGRLSCLWNSEDVSRLPDTINFSDFLRAEFSRTYRGSKTIIVRDTETDPCINPGPFRAIKMRSFIIVPFHRNAEWNFALIIADSRPREWREEEVDLICEVSNRVFPRIERARMEEELRASQQDLNRAQAVAHTGSWRLDVHRNKLLWSDETHRIFKIPQGTPMTYEAFLSAIYPDDREYVDRKWTAALHGEPYDIEHRIIDGDAIKWVREKAELEFDDKGTLLGGFGTVQDITERKRVEQVLQESEERFRSAFDKGAVPMTMTAFDGRLIAVNAAYSRMLGYSESELAGLNFYSITHQDDLAVNKAGIDSVVSGEKDSFRMEKRYTRKDGGIIWVDMSTASVRDTDGKPLYLVTHAQDITERKQMEEALRRSKDELEIKVQERTSQLLEANTALRQSEEKYRELVERSQSIIMRMDRAGKITFFNEFAERFFGYSQQEILGRNVVGTIVPETESSGRNLRTLLKDISHNPERYANNENENIRKNGEMVWIAWTNAPVRDARGKLLEVLCVGNDITERKKMEERLRSMASEIVFADERTRQHFATDLHDTVVQTLGAAKMRSQLIQDSIPPEAKPVFTELQDMLSQSITQSRMIMAEMSPPVLYELGFVPALEWLTEQMESRQDIAITFETNAIDSRPLVHEIQVLLFQATRELLMNVVKHAKSDSAVVKLSDDGRRVRIEVTDNGTGFDKRQAFRTDISGGGFGLFSIRERLRHFGGELRIWSKPGKGSRVVVTVPGIIAK